MKKTVTVLLLLVVLNMALFSVILWAGNREVQTTDFPRIPYFSPTLQTPDESHTHTYAERVVRAATCTKNGVTDLECVCGDVIRKYPLPLDHTPVATEEDIPATCLTEGRIAQRICADCGKSVSGTEWLPALGHNTVNGVCTRCSATGEDVQAVAFGDLTDSIHWRLDRKGEASHELEITGSGEIPDLEEGRGPWNEAGYVTAVSLSEGITGIGAYFLAGSGISTLVLPEGLEYIGEGAFKNCGSLEKVSLPNSLKTVGKDAFKGCYLIPSLVLPEGLEEIAPGAFEGCRNLVELTDLSKLQIVPDASTGAHGDIGRYLLGVHNALGEDSFLHFDGQGLIYFDDGARCVLIGSRHDPMSTGSRTFTLEKTFQGKSYSIRAEFWSCAPAKILYEGSMAEWATIYTPADTVPFACTVQCSDGELVIESGAARKG